MTDITSTTPGTRGADHPDNGFTAEGGHAFIVDADADGVWIGRDEPGDEYPPVALLSLRLSEALDVAACLIRAVQESAGRALVLLDAEVTR